MSNIYKRKGNYASINGKRVSVKRYENGLSISQGLKRYYSSIEYLERVKRELPSNFVGKYKGVDKVLGFDYWKELNRKANLFKGRKQFKGKDLAYKIEWKGKVKGKVKTGETLIFTVGKGAKKAMFKGLFHSLNAQGFFRSKYLTEEDQEKEITEGGLPIQDLEVEMSIIEV